jgi:hypothetical protein
MKSEKITQCIDLTKYCRSAVSSAVNKIILRRGGVKGLVVGVGYSAKTFCVYKALANSTLKDGAVEGVSVIARITAAAGELSV